jgi:hypothetical protein
LIAIFHYIDLLDLRPIGPLILENKNGLNSFAHYNQSFFGDEFSTLGEPKNKIK